MEGRLLFRRNGCFSRQFLIRKKRDSDTIIKLEKRMQIKFPLKFSKHE